MMMMYVVLNEPDWGLPLSRALSDCIQRLKTSSLILRGLIESFKNFHRGFPTVQRFFQIFVII